MSEKMSSDPAWGHVIKIRSSIALRDLLIDRASGRSSTALRDAHRPRSGFAQRPPLVDPNSSRSAEYDVRDLGEREFTEVDPKRVQPNHDGRSA
jgi:hypothetical protein